MSMFSSRKGKPAPTTPHSVPWGATEAAGVCSMTEEHLHCYTINWHSVDSKICAQARIDTLNGEEYVKARVRAMKQDSQETLVPSATENDEDKWVADMGGSSVVWSFGLPDGFPPLAARCHAGERTCCVVFYAPDAVFQCYDFSFLVLSIV